MIILMIMRILIIRFLRTGRLGYDAV